MMDRDQTDQGEEFGLWLWRAYRKPAHGDLDAAMFTRWNMEVAFNAGRERRSDEAKKNSD